MSGSPVRKGKGYARLLQPLSTSYNTPHMFEIADRLTKGNAPHCPTKHTHTAGLCTCIVRSKTFGKLLLKKDEPQVFDHTSMPNPG